MSRVPNAVDFLQAYRQMRYRYEGLYRRQIEALRDAYAVAPTKGLPASVNQALEAHLREYFVNSFLRALNWRMDVSAEGDLPNLVPEAPVSSSLEGTKKFLDYLGTESGTTEPLLVVETKRPLSPLPRLKNILAASDATLASIIAAGLGGEELTGEWNEWLGTLRDYVKSVSDRGGRVPRRAVLTNGQWLIIFIDPSDSFLASGTPDRAKILVFTVEGDADGSNALIEAHYNNIFNWLEHQRVLDEIPPLSVGEVAFRLDPGLIDRTLHGLHLLYIEEPDFLEGSSVALSVSPVIKVMPILFLRSKYGAWFRVDSGRRIVIPHESEKLTEHLDNVRGVANKLLEDVNLRLGINLAATAIESHYASVNDFKSLRGVTEKFKAHPHYDEHVIVTGQHTHYFRLEPSVPGCVHHQWENSNGESCAIPVSIQRRSTTPRAFFVDRENHHCTHREVAAAKACQLAPDNRHRCGERSGNDQAPFCEIWRFERYLCCRTCILENVCTSAPAFTLPCHRPH